MYLAIPATSLFLEETWSRTGKIFTKERTAQLPSTFQNHLFTNINQRQFELYDQLYLSVHK